MQDLGCDMQNDGEVSKLVLFESSDGAVSLDVAVDTKQSEVWLTKDQMAILFGRDRSVVARHINSIYKEHELDEDSTCAKFAQVQVEGKREVKRSTNRYNLDVIISVGYRVKSQRGVEFRRWATDVLRRFVIEGRVENARRLQQLAQTISLLERVSDDLDKEQVMEVVKSYALALDLLDDYDHQRITKPSGSDAVYVLDYEECRDLIATLKFNDESSIFGIEKDDSFKSSIAAIYQSFCGEEIYPSIEEKAANLLYFIVKNHSFHDGNKRIAATIFLYFLDRNGMLYPGGQKIISDSALVATTIMIAGSKPAEKEAMVSLVMNFLA